MKVGVLVAVLLLPQLASAQASGFGTTHCQQFLDSNPQSDDTVKAAYVSWTQGFFAGLNMAHAGTDHIQFETPSPDQIIWYMHDYCLKNPRDMYLVGLTKMALAIASHEAANGTLKVQPH